jgi:death on curing protein
MNEPRWISKEDILAIHEMVIDETGGSHGVRDEALLESALSRPQNSFHYENVDTFGMASAYAEGICQNHPFIDGNKRTAFLAGATFLQANGYEIGVEQGNEQHEVFMGLANGEISREQLSDWYRDNSKQIESEFYKDVSGNHEKMTLEDERAQIAQEMLARHEREREEDKKLEI